MDQSKTGELIRALRIRQGLTQLQLADIIGVSDKAVSKWERGNGAPDIATLPALAAALGSDTESHLGGELPDDRQANGNVKKLRFFVCPHCGNILTALDGAAISCCGQRLTAAERQRADDTHRLTVEDSDGDWYCRSEHEMRREHYISFVAFVTDDTLMLKKLYPQWNMEARFPRYSHGILYFYCTEHGLFSMRI